MNAEIVAVGSEMLTPQRVDTNSLYLTAELNNLGVEVVTKYVIGDHLERLRDAVRHAISRSEILIVSGGLGPTEDDDGFVAAFQIVIAQAAVASHIHRENQNVALPLQPAIHHGLDHGCGHLDLRRRLHAFQHLLRDRLVGESAHCPSAHDCLIDVQDLLPF